MSGEVKFTSNPTPSISLSIGSSLYLHLCHPSGFLSCPAPHYWHTLWVCPGSVHMFQCFLPQLTLTLSVVCICVFAKPHIMRPAYPCASLYVIFFCHIEHSVIPCWVALSRFCVCIFAASDTLWLVHPMAFPQICVCFCHIPYSVTSVLMALSRFCVCVCVSAAFHTVTSVSKGFLAILSKSTSDWSDVTKKSHSLYVTQLTKNVIFFHSISLNGGRFCEYCKVLQSLATTTRPSGPVWQYPSSLELLRVKDDYFECIIHKPIGFQSDQWFAYKSTENVQTIRGQAGIQHNVTKSQPGPGSSMIKSPTKYERSIQ